MRRLALLPTFAVSAALLAGCGGGPEALSTEDAEAALLTEESFPLDGFTKSDNGGEESESEDDEDQSFEDIVFMFEDVPDGCKDAGKEIDESETFNTDDDADGPTATFEKDDSVAEVSISEKKDNYEDAVKAIHKLADECGELTGGPYDMKMSFEKIDEDDARGMEMKIGVLDEVQRLTLLTTSVGENVISTSVEHMSQDDAKKILEAQKRAVEEK
ncbi:hypothetical protein BJF82_04780 [Kytococcus sp. CUA-901]|nr:hypothetical protein BJF82_04780 [Kytococcus sp. CUA-901]